MWYEPPCKPNYYKDYSTCTCHVFTCIWDSFAMFSHCRWENEDLKSHLNPPFKWGEDLNGGLNLNVTQGRKQIHFNPSTHSLSLHRIIGLPFWQHWLAQQCHMERVTCSSIHRNISLSSWTERKGSEGKLCTVYPGEGEKSKTEWAQGCFKVVHTLYSQSVQSPFNFYGQF